MRAWRGRWSTTSPAATAGRPTDCWSTPATPQPNEKETVKPATLARRIRKRAKEPFCLKEWRERMASEAGQAVYALRQRIERINADRKNHGFGFLPVRGLIKAKAHALWHALANNLMAARRLRIETPGGAHKVITPLPFATRTAFTARASDSDLSPLQTQKCDSFTRSRAASRPNEVMQARESWIPACAGILRARSPLHQRSHMRDDRAREPFKVVAAFQHRYDALMGASAGDLHELACR